MALNGRCGQAQGLGGFVDRQTAVIAQLDDACLDRIDGFKARQCLVEVCRVDAIVAEFDRQGHAIEIDSFATIALGRVSPAGMVGQHLAHEPGSDGDEMNAVLPVDPVEFDQPLPGLVDERRGLQRVVRTLATEKAHGHRGA